MSQWREYVIAVGAAIVVLLIGYALAILFLSTFASEI